MTKIEMINMAIDLSYIQGRVQGNPGMVDCYDHLVNAIDNLVETIAGEETPFTDGACSDCKNWGTYLDKEPCLSCRPTNWEAKGEDE